MSVNRRQFTFAASGLLSWQAKATAQTARRVARIGWLGLGDGKAGSTASIPFDGLRTGLRSFGWVEGENLVIETRNGNFGNAQALTAELLQAKVELIVAEGGMIFRARPVAGATPLVFHVNGDPVEAKLVASYARPGGSLTGMTNLSAELSGKRVELLKEALPHMTRMAAIANQGHPGWQVEFNATQAACRQVGLALDWFPVFTAQDFEAAFNQVARSGAQGLVAVPDNLILGQARAIAEFAAKHGIPAISGSGEFVDAGNLASYGPVQRDVYGRLGAYVDRLLRGATPADLPVENPTRFELVFNLGLARTLKLKVPQAILVRIDRSVR